MEFNQKKKKNSKKPRSQTDCDTGLALDLMWSDPDSDPCAKGFTPNKIRNASWMFGQDMVKECVEVCLFLNSEIVLKYTIK